MGDITTESSPSFLKYQDFESLVKSVSDEIVAALIEHRNNDIQVISKEKYPPETLETLLATVEVPDTASTPALVVLAWVIHSAEKKLKDKAKESASKLSSNLSSLTTDLASETAAQADLSSYPIGIDYDRFLPADLEAQFEEDIWLVQNFPPNTDIHTGMMISILKTQTFRSLIRLRASAILPEAIIARIKEEIANCMRIALVEDFNKDESNFAALSNDTVNTYLADKSPRVKELVTANRNKILRLVGIKLLKPCFLEIMELLIAKEYENADIANRLIKKFGETNIGEYLNNFSLFIRECVRKRGNSHALYYIHREAKLDEPIDSEFLGTIPPETTWRQFFADVDAEFDLLTTPDEEWLGAGTYKTNCHLLPAYIGMAKKGYNVNQLTH